MECLTKVNEKEDDLQPSRIILKSSICLSFLPMLLWRDDEKTRMWSFWGWTVGFAMIEWLYVLKMFYKADPDVPRRAWNRLEVVFVILAIVVYVHVCFVLYVHAECYKESDYAAQVDDK